MCLFVKWRQNVLKRFIFLGWHHVACVLIYNSMYKCVFFRWALDFGTPVNILLYPNPEFFSSFTLLIFLRGFLIILFQSHILHPASLRQLIYIININGRVLKFEHFHIIIVFKFKHPTVCVCISTNCVYLWNSMDFFMQNRFRCWFQKLNSREC